MYTTSHTDNTASFCLFHLERLCPQNVSPTKQSNAVWVDLQNVVVNGKSNKSTQNIRFYHGLLLIEWVNLKKRKLNVDSIHVLINFLQWLEYTSLFANNASVDLSS